MFPELGVQRPRPLGMLLVKHAPPPSALASCLSRSLKVIDTDANLSATYDFPLLVHSSSGAISQRLINKYLTAELTEYPWNFGRPTGLEN